VQRHVTVGTFVAGHVDDAINVFGLRNRAQVGCVSFAPAGFLAACFPFASAKRCGLAMSVSVELLDFLAQAKVFVFQFGDAALPAVAFLAVSGEFGLKAVDNLLALLAARASSMGEYHGRLRSVPC